MFQRPKAESPKQDPLVGCIFYEDGYPDKPLVYLGQPSPGVYSFRDADGKITESMTLDGYFENPPGQTP